MRRIWWMVMAMTLVTGTVAGLAASLSLTSAKLGSDVAPVSSCDTDGVTADYTVVLGLVSSVVVTGIADGSAVVGNGACDGEVVNVELLDGAGGLLAGAIGSLTLTGDLNTTDDSAVVAMTTPPLAADVGQARITLRTP